jgi:hypothetical protein
MQNSTLVETSLLVVALIIAVVVILTFLVPHR